VSHLVPALRSHRWLAANLGVLLLLAIAGVGLWYWRAAQQSELPPPPLRHAAQVTATPSEPSLLLLPITFEPSALNEIALRMPRQIPIPSRTHRKRFRWGSVSIRTDGRILLTAIKLRAKNDALVFTANADAELNAYVAGHRQTATALAAIDATVHLDVDQDWRLQPRIELEYRWLEPPTTRLLGMDIDLEHEADKALRGRVPELEQRLTESLRERIDVRAQVERVWARAQQPIALNANPPVWLAIEPLGVYLAPPASNAGALQIMLGLQARLRVVHFVGAGSPAIFAVAATPIPLPPPQAGPIPNSGLRLNVDIDADYAAMSATLSTLLGGHTLHLDTAGGNIDVTFDEFDVYPAAPKLVVGARIRVDGIGWGATRGWIYLTGTPAYDASKEQLLIRDINFVSATDHPLLQAVSELMRERIRAELASAAHIDLMPQLQKLRIDADTQLNRALDLALDSKQLAPRTRELLAGRLQLSGHLTSVEVAAITPAETALTARIELGAEVSLQVR
jgi:hypothetical protein